MVPPVEEMVPLEVLLGLARPLPFRAAITPALRPMSDWSRALRGKRGTTLLVAETFWERAAVASRPPATARDLQRWQTTDPYTEAEGAIEHAIDLWRRRLGPDWARRLERLPPEAARNPEEPDAPLWTDLGKSTDRADTVEEAKQRCVDQDALGRVVWVDSTPEAALALLTGHRTLAGLWRSWQDTFLAQPAALTAHTLATIVHRPPNDEAALRALAVAHLALDPLLADDGVPFLLWWLHSNHYWQLNWSPP